MSNEMIQFNLEEGVNSEWGNDALRKHLYGKKAKSKKGKGNLGANQIKQLLRNMEVDWDKVEVSGDGADRTITCIGRKEIPTERQDKRKGNGKRQIPYEDIVRNLVLLYLSQEKDTPATMTISVLAHELEMMSNTLYVASKKGNAIQQQAHYDNLEPKYQVGYSMFWHIVTKESKRIKDHLKSILSRMSNDGIIYYRDVTNAVTIEDGREEHNLIDNVKAFEIKRMQRSLREKHDIVFADIRYRPHHHKVLAYKEDEERYFNSLNIKYVYEAKMIGLTATEKEITNYLKDNLVFDFKISHAENAKRLAEKVQNEFFDKLLKSKDNSQLIEEIGGRAKPEHAIFNGTEYELVLKDAKRLAYDSIAQAKVSGTYPIEYTNKLKALQDISDEKEVHN